MNKLITKSFLIITITLFFTNGLKAQTGDWNWFKHLPQNHIRCLKPIPGAQKLIAVGDAGTIMLSNDFGINWNEQYLLQFQYSSIKSVSFPDSTTGYLAGGAGFVFKTYDGGQSWIELHCGSIEWLNTVFFPVKDTGYISGQQGTLLKTIDGGINWNTLNFPTSYEIKDIYFLNAQRGYAITDYGGIYFTIDGGNTWTQQVSNVTGLLNSIYFLNDSTGFVTGYLDPGAAQPQDHYILKTTDGGTTWNGNHSISLQKKRYSKVFFTSADTGYVSYQNGLLKTTDGGITLTEQNVLRVNTVNDIAFLNKDTGFIAMDNGVMQKTFDASLNWIPVTDTIINPYLTSCWFFNDTTGLVVSNSRYSATSNILKTSDKGQTWDTVFQNYNGYYFSKILFINDSIGFTVLNKKYLLKTNDKGDTWATINTSLPGSLADFYFLNDTVGFIINNDGYRTSDGGISWNLIPGNVAGASMDFINDSIGVTGAGAGYGMVFKTSDKGFTWNLVATNIGYAGFRKILFLNDSTLIAINGYGQIYKSFDQAITWNHVSTTYLQGPNMYFTSDSIGYCIGYYGMIVRTVDQGNTWTVQQSKSFSHLESASFINDSTGYIVAGIHSLIYTNNSGGSVCPKATFSPSTLFANVGDTIDFRFLFFYWQIDSSTSFLWNYGDGTTDNVSFSTHAYTTPGDYTVTFIVYYKGCVDSSTCVIHIANPLFVRSNSHNYQIKIYPNPTSGKLIVESKEKKIFKISVSNISGQNVLSNNYTINKSTLIQLDLSNQPKGVYIMQIFTDKEFYRQKLIIQ